MTLAPLPVIGSTPDDSLLAALDSLPAQSDTGAVVEWAQTEPWLPNEPQTASESHWRVSAQIGPKPSLRSVGRILSRFLGPRRGWRGSDITSGRHFDATLLPSSKRGSPTVGPPGFQLRVRVCDRMAKRTTQPTTEHDRRKRRA
jgi:hypothetical protein